MRHETQILREIAVIRDLQRQTAQADAARAASLLRRAEEAREELSRERDATEDIWRDGLRSTTMPLDLIPLWSAHLASQDAAIVRANQDVARASQLSERKRSAWSAAVNKADHSQTAARNALQDELEARDDRALQNALDRHAVPDGRMR